MSAWRTVADLVWSVTTDPSDPMGLGGARPRGSLAARSSHPVASGLLVLICAAALRSCAGPGPRQPTPGRRVILSRWPQGKRQPLLGYRGRRVTQKQGLHGWDVTAGPALSTCPVLQGTWGQGPGSPLPGMFRDSK